MRWKIRSNHSVHHSKPGQVLFFAGEQSPSTHQDIKKSPGYFLGSVSNTEAFHESTLLLVKPQSNQSNKKCSVLEDVSP